jgi:xanthine dehydrogenase small subunit
MYAAPRRAFDPAPTLRALEALAADGSDDFVYEAASTDPAQAPARFHAPRTVQALAALREALPHARILAGSTDVGLWVTKQFRHLGDIVYLGEVETLRSCQLVDDAPGRHLRVGAAATLEEAWSALAEPMPVLREIWRRFASPPVRHAGTLVGNLANGSPIGDSAPILLALDATLALRKGDAVRTLPLSAFYLDYMQNALQAGEFIESVSIPIADARRGEVMRAYKVSKRRDSDISAVCAGLWLKLDGDRILDARLGWGGMAATARRAHATEAALKGRIWDEATLRQAQTALSTDFQPMTDLRASSTYRLKVASNLLERFWLETRPGHPLPADQVQVWTAME